MGIFKDAFIERHGEVAYAEKLAKNAKYQADNADALAEKRKKKLSRYEDTLLLIGDVHVGASSVDVDEIKELAKRYWSKNPIVLIGDLCDLGLDRGMQWDQKYGPQKQIDLIEEIFPPLDIRGFCSANHENRIYEKAGLTPYIRMFGMQPSNQISINGREVYFNHGKSAAENYFLEFQKYVKWCDVDLVALGHSHDLARVTFQRGKKIQHLVRTGSFLGRPKYVLDAGFAPKIRGWAEFDTVRNKVNLKGLTEEGEVFDL